MMHQNPHASYPFDLRSPNVKQETLHRNKNLKPNPKPFTPPELQQSKVLSCQHYLQSPLQFLFFG